MADQFLNKTGLARLWAKVRAYADTKLPLTGGTLTGGLTLDPVTNAAPVLTLVNAEKAGAGPSRTTLRKNASASADYGTQLTDYVWGNGTTSNQRTVLCLLGAAANPAGRLTLIDYPGDGSYTQYRLYGEHNRPAVSDVTGLSAALEGKASAGDVSRLFEAESFGPAAQVSFTADREGLPLLKCLAEIQPVQSGSGDPSPSNVRPISGWTGLRLHVSPTAGGTDGKTCAADWSSEAGTVFCGTLDVLAGTLTVTHKIADLGSLNWAMSGGSYGYNLFYCLVPGKKPNGKGELISAYKASSAAFASLPDQCWRCSTGTARLNLRDDAYRSAAELKAGVQGVQYLYELETPEVRQLSPQTVTVPAGQNFIRADTGDVTVEYGAFLAALQGEIERLGSQAASVAEL